MSALGIGGEAIEPLEGTADELFEEAPVQSVSVQSVSVQSVSVQSVSVQSVSVQSVSVQSNVPALAPGQDDQRAPTVAPSVLVEAVNDIEQPNDIVESDRRQSSVRIMPQRVLRVWQGWLERLASDPEAALAAALAYRELAGPGRDEWLSALDADLGQLGVPRLAVYAPLLAVETDAGRRLRIESAIAPSGGAPAEVASDIRVLVGSCPDGRHRMAVIQRPLYLDFVQVLACSYVPGAHFRWVRHDPIALQQQAPKAGDLLDGQRLDFTPTHALLDELASTIVAHTRSGFELPEALCLFADVFSPRPDGR